MSPADLETTLALVRGGTLARAGERLGVDASTVFRSLQRLERGLGRPLFERTRSGYAAGELALQLAEHAERMEAEVEAARSSVDAGPSEVSGSVRITTTDDLLHALVGPALATLAQRHPLLEFELRTGNEPANLRRRDADVAVRDTRRPPQHLVGRRIGPLRSAVYGPRKGASASRRPVDFGAAEWVAPDDALPSHPTVTWRRRQWPKARPRYRVDSLQSVVELVAGGLGIGVVPMFLAEGRRDVVRLSEPIAEAETELWVLTHPESRHLRRIGAVYAHLAESLQLP